MGIHYKTNVGEIKRTKNQIKKHYTQFTIIEDAILRHIAKDIANKKVNISKHAVERLKTVSKTQIYDCLCYGTPIEFNVTNGKCRLLMRGDRKVSMYIEGKKQYGNLCVVVDIKVGDVVTAYLNLVDDNHKSLDMTRYDETINILEYAR